MEGYPARVLSVEREEREYSAEMENSMRVAVVDIGGTSIKSGIWEEGQIREVKETDTNAGQGGSGDSRAL